MTPFHEVADKMPSGSVLKMPKFKKALASFVVPLLFHGIAVAAPKVPLPSDVKGYERLTPVFKSTAVANGAELLGALKGGKTLKPWLADSPLASQAICVLPELARWWVTLRQTNGSEYGIGFTSDGALVYLPDGIYKTDNETREVLRKLLDKLEDNLKDEVTTAKKPCTYRVGTMSDGGTLSGIAKLFYNKPGKWKLIFEANRRTISDPNVIQDGMALTIPAAP